MFNSKIASLEARIARLESRMTKKAFLSGNTIIQMIDPRTKRIEAQDTLSSFFLSNSDDEEVTEALVQLRSGKISELQVATGQGYYILRVAKYVD